MDIKFPQTNNILVPWNGSVFPHCVKQITDSNNKIIWEREEPTGNFLTIYPLTHTYPFDEVRLSMSIHGDVPDVNIEYSFDAVEWTRLTTGRPLFGWNRNIYLRGYNPLGLSKSSSDYVSIGLSTSATRYGIKGNIMHLLDYNRNLTVIPCDYCFYSLFNSNSYLKDVSELYLPATTLTKNCYMNLFSYCVNLDTVVELPATQLQEECYRNMFTRTAIKEAPILPAMNLAKGCYDSMFYGCENLETAPVLPATQLTIDCYSAMFHSCTKLKTAPDLPASQLVSGCYEFMFKGCTDLTNIKCLATNISATNATLQWVDNVASSGTFIKKSSTSWSRGISGIPTGWTIQNI